MTLRDNMASAQLNDLIKQLRDFITTVDTADSKATAAIANINTVLNQLNLGQFSAGVKATADNFKILLENSRGSVAGFNDVRTAMEKLIETSTRLKGTTVAREQATSVIGGAEPFANLPYVNTVRTPLKGQQAVQGSLDNLTAIREALANPKLGVSAGAIQNLAAKIIQTEKAIDEKLMTEFAQAVEESIRQIGINAAGFKPGALPTLVQQREAFGNLQKQRPSTAQATGNEDYLKTKFSPAAIDNLTKSISKYGLSLSDLNKIQREMSTGVTRLDFAPQMDDNVDAVERLNLTLDKHGNVLEDTQKRYRTFGDAILRDIKEVAKWTIAVAIVYAPIRKLGELIQQMIENQSKLADVQIATNASTEQMGAVFDRIAQVATRTGETITGTIDAYKLAYQAAGNIAEPHIRAATATRLLSDTLVLAKLSGMDHAQAMDVLSGALKQVGMSLNDGSILLDKWVAVSKAANVNIATLAQSFAITSTAAEGVGLDIDKLNGVIAAVSEVTNKSAEETGNMVRAFISGFQTDNAREELAKYGISIYDAEGRLRDFMDVMREVRGMMDTGIISKDEAGKLAEVLGGGARRGAQYAAFFQNFQRADQIARVSAMASGEAYAALGIKIGTVETESTKLANAFTMVAQSLGSEGGMLDNATAFLKVLTFIVEKMSDLTKLLGRATPLIAALGISGAYLARNPASKASLAGSVGGMVYNPLYSILNSFYKKTGTPPDTTSGLGVPPTLDYETYRERDYLRKQQALRAAAPTSEYYPNLQQQQGLVGLKGSEAVADKMASRFVQGVKENIGAVFAIGAVALTTSMHAMAGEWGQAAASSLGAALGGTIGLAAFGTLNPLMIILGQALGEAFYNTFLNYTPNLATAIADAIVSATETKTPEGEKKAETERLTEGLFEAIGRRQEKATAPWVKGNRIPDEYAEMGKTAVGSTFEIATMFNRGPKDTFTKFIQNYMKGFLLTDIQIKQAAEFALTGRDIDQDQYAILSAISGAYGEAAKKAAIKLLEEMRKQAGEGLGVTSKDVSTPVTQRRTGYSKQFAEQGTEFQKRTSADLLKQLSFGEINLRGYTTQQDSLKAINDHIIAIYTNLMTLDETKNVFDEMDDSINGSAATYEKLANVILKLSPEETEELGKVNQGLDDLYTKFKETGKGADEYAQKQQELVQLLQTMASGQFTKGFQAPNIFELPEGTTQAALRELINGAKDLQDQYLKTFVPDEATRAKIVAEYAKLAILIGKVFSGSIEGVGNEFLQKFLQTMQEEGKIQTGNAPQFQIRQVEPNQFNALNQGVLDRWMGFIRQRFPDYKLEEQNFGLISGNQTKILHGDNLALQLAMQELIDVNRKQLDGIYNLPTDASFYVPFQGYKLGFDQGGGGGIDWSSVPDDMENSTYRGTYQGILDSMGFASGEERKLAREGRSSFLKEGGDVQKSFPYPLKEGQTQAGIIESMTNLLGKKVGQIELPQYGPPYQMPPYVPPQTATTTPTTPPYKIFGDEILDSLRKFQSGALQWDQAPKEPSKLDSLLDLLNKFVVKMGIGGAGERMPGFPTEPILPKAIGKTEIPKLDTKLSLNINSNIQLMVDGRMLAAIIKQYLYEDLIRSEGVAGSITRTIAI